MMYTKLIEKYVVFRTNLKIKKLNNYTGNSSPYFSVVIPVYDRTSELREAIESILFQTFANFEMLLICDGSPLETVEIVKTYTSHPKVRAFFFKDNSGNPCRGRNKGIEMALGRFVAFLDSDDIAMPNRLEKTLYHLFTKKVDVVGGAIQYLTENDSCREFRNGQLGFTSEDCTYDLLLQGNRLSICTVAVRKSCLDRFGGFREEMRYREDHELWLRLAYRGCTFYNSPEVFAQYRVHNSNAELSYMAEDQKWYEKALNIHCKGVEFEH
jgi:glycosyltransferase involved in cell wall biosynthesis